MFFFCVFFWVILWLKNDVFLWQSFNLFLFVSKMNFV